MRKIFDDLSFIKGELIFMEKEIYIDAVKKMNCVLDLKRKVVGVRFLFTKEEFEEAQAEKPKGRMPYCKMINRAMGGDKIKVDFDNFGCFAAARVLGIVDLDDWYTSGHYAGYTRICPQQRRLSTIFQNVIINLMV